MRRSLAKISESDFTTTMPELKFSVHTGRWLTNGCGHRAVVFHARGEAFARSCVSWCAALATAHDGVPEHVRAVSAARNFRALPGPKFPPRAALGRGDFAHRAA